MDLNYILVWLVGASTAVQAFVVWNQVRWTMNGWYLVLGLIGSCLGVSSLLLPGAGGIVTAPLWALFVLAPALLNNATRRAVQQERFGRAARLASLLGRLHPFGAFREQPWQMRFLEAQQRADLERAHRCLDALIALDGRLAGWAWLQRFNLDGDWEAMVEWAESMDAERGLMRQSIARIIYLRALGELGQVERMIRSWVRFSRLRGNLNEQIYERVIVLTYAGRLEAARRLISAIDLGLESRGFIKLYEAIGELVAGLPRDPILVRLEDMVLEASPSLRWRIERTLAAPPPAVDPTALSSDANHVLDVMQSEISPMLKARRNQAAALALASRPTWATWAAVGLITAVFLLEIPGGTTNERNLFELGMLVVPIELTGDQYWRYLTAGLLHYGPVHFALNAIALTIFGRTLERLWGRWRMAATFLLTNLAGVVAVGMFAGATVEQPVTLVGASGGVMGVLGALTAVLLRAWRVRRDRMLKNQLVVMVLVLGVQIVFDAMTPIVSQHAHLGGLAVGFAMGLLFGPTPGHPKTKTPG